MKWITILPFTLLLSACIYTEGTPIIEPQDVVVAQQANKMIAAENYCATNNLTSGSYFFINRCT